MELRIEYNLERGVSRESQRLLDIALAHMFETGLGIKLGRLSGKWRVANCGGPRVEFDATSSDPHIGIFGTAVIEDGCLKGFTGTYTVPSASNSGTREFRLKIPPISVLWILAAAKAAEPQKTSPDAEFDVPDSMLEDVGGHSGGLMFDPSHSPFDGVAQDIFDTPQDMFDFPYEFKTPGQMDHFVNGLLSCMERTITERMDCQDMFIDRIALPDGVCPGVSAVRLKLMPFGDALFAETVADGGRTETLFSELGVDRAAEITKYVMEHYPKQPLLK